ncbi:hypothetical protein HY312_00320 [Candidatus Saccharibacteria bacterium]|nr:hypothetical protein [Candidatus Saccharibacteria bacterium]
MKKSPSPSMQLSASALEKQLTSPSVTFILATATIGAIVYMIFLLQPQFRGDLLPYLMVIAAELFLILHGILSFWTILSGRINPRNFDYHHAQDALFGPSSKTITKNLHSVPIAASRAKQLNINKEGVNRLLPALCNTYSTHLCK